MKKNLFYCSILLLSGLMSCGNSAKQHQENEASLEGENVAQVAAGEAKSHKVDYKVVEGRIIPVNDRPMIVDFSAVWCPPCQKLKPIFESLRDKYHREVDFLTIDVDSLPSLATNYGVQNIPTILYLNKHGEVIGRTMGFQTAEELSSGLVAYFGVQP